MKTKFIKTVETTGRNFITCIKPFALAFSIAGCIIFSNVAFAATSGQDIFAIVVQVFGGIALINAAMQIIPGWLAYSEAKAEGEGPAMTKAENKLKAGIVSAVIGGALLMGAKTLAGLIVDNIRF